MKKTVDQLVKEFVGNAIERGAALERGNSKLANSTLARLNRIYRGLGSRGDEGREASLGLLHHADPWVRLGAATFALDSVEAEAVSVLQELSAGPGVLGLTAGLLRDWSVKRSR